MRERILPLALELLRAQLLRRGARSLTGEVDGVPAQWFEVPGEDASGPTLVLVHGLGSSATGWSRVMFLLRKRASRVLVPDLPGAGFCPLPACGALGFEALLEYFGKFVERYGGERPVLVGNSLGGAMVARHAARHAAKLSGAVLIAPAGAPLGPEKLKQTLTVYADGTVEGARELMKRVYARPPPIIPSLLAPGMRDLLARPNVVRLVEEATKVEGLQAQEVRSLTLPLLLIWGRQEKVLPPEGIDFFREHLPSTAEIHHVDGFGHCPQLERPRELVGLIDSFLQRRLDRRAA